MTVTTKIYATRDSATSALRKIGLQARDYNFFITKVGDKFECRVGDAIAHLEALKNPKLVEPKAATPKVKAAKAGRRAADPVVKTATISTVARDMILDGKTDQEVWAALVEQFNLDDSKKHYPTWYRCEMKRKGLVQ
jgi:hypothetical protein